MSELKTFGGHPIHLMKIGDKTMVSCKGVIGSLEEAIAFQQDPNKNKIFGSAKIRQRRGKIAIDCLEDTPVNFDALVEYAKNFDQKPNIVVIEALKGMDKTQRADVMRIVNEGDEEIEFTETIAGYEDEILYALHLAIHKIYGKVIASATPAMSGNIKPRYKTIHIPDTGEEISILYGQIPLPGMQGGSYIETNYIVRDRELEIECNVRVKNVNDVKLVIELTRDLVNTNSFYKSKLLIVDNLVFAPGFPPVMVSTSTLEEIDILLSPSVINGLSPFISRIKSPEACLKAKVNPKYSLLLAGPGGTGKTAIMFNYIAPIALQSGYTILYAKDATLFPKVLRLAEMLVKRGWKPLIVIEDIDQAFDGEERGSLQQEILNTLDSGHNKTSPIMTVMTTNFITKISSYMMRAGRISKVIELGGLTKEDAILFIDKYLEELKDPNQSYDKVIEAIIDIVPAFVREIINECKIVAFSNEDKFISSDLLLTSIAGYRRQEELTKVSGGLSKEEEFFNHSYETFRQMFVSWQNDPRDN